MEVGRNIVDVMAQVRIGMRVLDSMGEEIGTIDDLKAGDPGAVTGEGQVMGGDGGLLGDIGRVFGGGPELHRQVAERLLRVGYIKIGREGFLAEDAYAAADRIQEVDNDTVRLSITSDQLHDG